MTLTRKTPMSRHKAQLKAGEKKLRMRKCAVKGCGNRFTPRSITHKACGPDCAAKVAEAKRIKDEQHAAKVERQQTRAQLMEMKPLHYWAKRAEKACNAYIRARDEGDPCITCNTYDAPIWHAGHMYTVKARPDIRFHEDNIHLQCPDCNTFNAGKADEYKRRVIGKIGVERFEALKRVNPAFKKTREYYQAVEAEYKAKLKELKAGEA